MAGYFREHLIEGDSYCCDKCQVLKPFEDFPRCGKTSSGSQVYRRYCRICWSHEKRDYRRTPAGFFEGLWSNLVSKARDRGISVEITKQDILDLYEQQGGFCAVTGLPMQTSQSTGINDYAASVDRIDSGGDYTVDNIHLVCVRVNIMKMDMTQEQLEFWCSRITGSR